VNTARSSELRKLINREPGETAQGSPRQRLRVLPSFGRSARFESRPAVRRLPARHGPGGCLPASMCRRRAARTGRGGRGANAGAAVDQRRSPPHMRGAKCVLDEQLRTCLRTRASKHPPSAGPPPRKGRQSRAEFERGTKARPCLNGPKTSVLRPSGRKSVLSF
jgi:hypothetical protein